jgi:hypothetical protein
MKRNFGEAARARNHRHKVRKRKIKAILAASQELSHPLVF